MQETEPIDFPDLPTDFGESHAKAIKARGDLRDYMNAHGIAVMDLAKHEVWLVGQGLLESGAPGGESLLIGVPGFRSLASATLGPKRVARAGFVIKAFMRWRQRQEAARIAAEGEPE